MLRWLAYALVSLAALPVTQASANVCPNEAIRAALSSARLPDCRAYELTSPVAKYGLTVQVLRVSSDGERLIASSIGAFSGSSQTSPFNYYEFVREPGGWGTMPLNTPAGYFNPNASSILTASPDLRNGLFEYRLSATEDPWALAYYVRALPAGPPTEVGPLYSPSALASNPVALGPNSSEPSTSRDLSRVLFMIEGPTTGRGPLVDYVWPGDTTAEAGGQGFISLYEYAGTGNSEPKLVGVRNEDMLKSNTEAQLISRCGTSLGFPEEGSFTRLQGKEIYNAVSEDGSHVFFTVAGPCESGGGPPTDELYARIDGKRSVAISEPSHPLAQGSSTGPEECDATCEAAAPMPGIFQGASENGSKVFFLTAQPLLNSDQDTGTDLYEAEIGGEGVHARIGRLVRVSHDPTVGQAAEVQGVARVSEDGSHVYFVARGELTSAPNPVGSFAHAGAENLYVYERDARYPGGHTAFIGKLSATTDANDWSQRDLRPVDANSCAPGEGECESGRFLVFTSSEDLTPDDKSSLPQVFVYDAQAETLVRVSRAQGGLATEGGEYPATISYPNYTGNLNPADQPTSISDDGAYVVFQSEAGLTPQAAVGHNNVYEYHDGQVSLISDGQDRSVGQGGFPSTRLVGVDGSGEDIFFTTADRLVPQDGDTQEDVYDARVKGGFLPPLGPAACEGSACQGPFAPSPQSAAGGGSASQPAGEQVLEPPVKPLTKAKAKRKVRKAKRNGAKRARHSASKSARRNRRR
jgi:hypothetical protein